MWLPGFMAILFIGQGTDLHACWPALSCKSLALECDIIEPVICLLAHLLGLASQWWRHHACLVQHNALHTADQLVVCDGLHLHAPHHMLDLPFSMSTVHT